jgi:hypothetical protein
MRLRKKHVALGLVAAVTVISACLFFLQHAEPRYQGKTVRQWWNHSLRLVANDDMYDNSHESQNGFNALADTAIPFLEKKLQPRGALKKLYYSCYRKCPYRLKKRLPRVLYERDEQGRALSFLVLASASSPEAFERFTSSVYPKLTSQQKHDAILSVVSARQKPPECVISWVRSHTNSPDPTIQDFLVRLEMRFLLRQWDKP